MYYFAYGSNLDRKQMRECCPNSKPRFKATLPNYKLIFSGWSRKWHGGLASIKRTRDEKVIGGVYEISERDLMSLDKHEGYPTVYGRINVTVFAEDGDPVEAVTHIKREQVEETKPSPEYAAVIRQGYRDWEII
jgi:gamma-glutamylcyclotransferase (GGCT)/AIG2-like uncharacterized protein YtfP